MEIILNRKICMMTEIPFDILPQCLWGNGSIQVDKVHFSPFSELISIVIRKFLVTMVPLTYDMNLRENKWKFLQLISVATIN